MKQATERYFHILQQVALTGDTDAIEVHLADAFELGRVLVDRNVPPDEVTHIHHEAMVRLSGAHPLLSFARVADRVNRPLMEMSMAHGLAFREQIERRYRTMVTARLEKAYAPEADGSLAAGIVNDFNNLLGIIIGFAEMAGDDLPEGSSGRRSFNVMMENLNTLLAAKQTMQEKITVNERRLRTLVENTPDIITRYDRDCRLVFVNPAYMRETGTSLEQIRDKSIRDADIWRPTMPCEEYSMRLRQVMDTGIPDLVMLEWHRPDGQRVSHEMYVVAEYDDDDRVIGSLAIGRDVTRRRAAERQLLHHASYDDLSGLPNRRMLDDRLHEEIALAKHGGYCLAVLFIDLDRFKDVNDTLGHAFGDQLLIATAQRISGCVRESDTVARLAGDEFVVILPRICENEPLERIAQNISAVMAESFQIGERNACISASIGIAVFPRDADYADALIGCADQSMYAVKQAGRNGFSFFTNDMREEVRQRLQLSRDLRKALEKSQLEVYYQPIIDVAGGGRADKAEALLRWRHPELGMVPPDRFIPIAEETGLIHELGAWVFREAVDTATCWNARTTEAPVRQISVNMSPLQFVKGACDGIIIDYLRSRDIDPQCIAVEITEGLLLEDSPQIMEQLRKLRAVGIQISLDDFGTGYSALSYLKKFNLDYLKIDRSFVRDLETDPGALTIAEAIIAMAHRLGLKVIAEGVETPGQSSLLATAGCEYMQGYLYARPMPVEAFLAFVNAGAQEATGGGELSIQDKTIAAHNVTVENEMLDQAVNLP